MDLNLKPESEKTRVRRRPYHAPQDQVEEIERHIQECIDAGLVEWYKKGDYSHHCSPCFLVSKAASTALQLVVDYGEVNKKTQNHWGSIPNIQRSLWRIAKCTYNTTMDKRSGFWQVDLTAAAQELLAFITPKGLVFKWKVMPFGVANAPAVFQELVNKISYILRRRRPVQVLIGRRHTPGLAPSRFRFFSIYPSSPFCPPLAAGWSRQPVESKTKITPRRSQGRTDWWHREEQVPSDTGKSNKGGHNVSRLINDVFNHSETDAE